MIVSFFKHLSEYKLEQKGLGMGQKHWVSRRALWSLSNSECWWEPA